MDEDIEKWCCRRNKCVDARKGRMYPVEVTVFDSRRGIEIFPECKECGYGKWLPTYHDKDFHTNEWKTCLFRKRE